MPQPVAGTFGYSPKALYAKRPHHAAGIALVAAEWAALEERMIHVHLLTVFNVPRSQEKLDEVVAERFAELFKQQIEGKFYRYALGGDYRQPRQPAQALIALGSFLVAMSYLSE